MHPAQANKKSKDYVLDICQLKIMAKNIRLTTTKTMTKDISNTESCNSQWNHERYEFMCHQTQVQMRKDLRETDTRIIDNFNKPLWWKQINKKYINYLRNITIKFSKVYLIVTYWTLYYNKRICSFQGTQHIYKNWLSIN